jgi:hypothetical protein
LTLGELDRGELPLLGTGLEICCEVFRAVFTEKKKSRSWQNNKEFY